MSRKWVWLALGALVIAGVSLRGVLDRRPTLAPKPLRHVDDAAQLLWPFDGVVDQQCEDFGQDLGVEVRVVTLRDRSEPVAPLAERLFRERHVGSDSPTGGILLVLEGEGGQARIEVSYSLEGVLPDAIVSQLARDQLVPYASHRAAGMAVMDVVQFLNVRLLDSLASGELALPDALRTPDRLSRLLASHSGGAGAQVALPKVPSHTEYKQPVPELLRERYAPSADPLESAAALQRTRRDLVGDPTLALFTEGSRVMRDRYPVTPYEEALRADAMDRSPVELQVRGDRAYLGSKHPARGFVPVLMVREQGLWRIDLVETFKSFFFDKDSVFRLANEASPYAEFAEPWIRRRDETLAPLDLGGESIEAAIARLEASTRAEDRFRLAELLMRNCFISAEAIPLYAEAARAAPSDSKIVLTYARRAGYLYMPIIAADAVAGLGPSYWTELAFLYESSGERELARQYYAKALDRNPGNDYARSALARLTKE